MNIYANKFLSLIDFEKEKEVKYNELDENKIKLVAYKLKEIHELDSSSLAKNQISKFIKNGLSELSKIPNKKIIFEEINKEFKRINNILNKSYKNRFIVNEFFPNCLEFIDEKVKINLDKATKGDKHFDLAFFIITNYLDKKEEELFLQIYDTYWEEYLIQQKILVISLLLIYYNLNNINIYNNYLLAKLNEERTIFKEKKLSNSFRKDEWKK
ncbi:Choline kinase family [Mycoplasmopsis meleagridis]|uniref:Choline kinase family n=1 Tax=Mycoplasmopsis meleagridis ATCC 25294 TaxID=1264554 RepID=A0A0F5H276_9BACT|nr:hypothetical protein [Mycoplasmopsis meleagridis]KKB26942.1 Choline kinase family [Mycoplasmopsis meleagridis ATCC 25294]OAD18531.1 Choline kinase family [Mycoplasmopsis meleagridis]VEU77600.1 Uncharacterised protein [Mycoplasmopsis meleagridis]